MRFLLIQLKNFGSYKSVEFNFTEQGLSLLQGTTGAGKSTLQDSIPWVLFGKTAKDGNVDDIRSWDCTEPTEGILHLEHKGIHYTATRVRGKPQQNDLYFVKDSDPNILIRGKDITDTQKLLNQVLGVSAELYLTSVYFNEFSGSSKFFTDPKSKKRELFELITNLSFPVVLQEITQAKKKETKKTLDQVERQALSVSAQIEQLGKIKNKLVSEHHGYETNKLNKIEKLETSIRVFEENKRLELEFLQLKSVEFENKLIREMQEINTRLDQLIETPTETCPLCKQQNESFVKAHQEKKYLETRLKEIKHLGNPVLIQINTMSASISPNLSALEALKQQENPHRTSIEDCNEEIHSLSVKHAAQISQQESLRHNLLSFEQLNTLSIQMRGLLLEQKIQDIEAKTNHYLNSYFDGEISITLQLEGGDDLNLEIDKNSHSCSYTQLSRGQRSILRLAFSVAIMEEAANEAGIDFSCLFFDEVLDGLSSALKVKAINLFRELNTRHETVMVIDHASEIEHEFDKRFIVTLCNDESKIEEL